LVSCSKHRDFFLVDELDISIKSIVSEFGWSPNQINEMYVDDIDYLGIEFWYEHLLQVKKSRDKNKPKS